MSRFRNTGIFFVPFFILFACKQNNVGEPHTSKGWKLTTRNTEYYLNRKDREQYIWLNADSTFEGDAWIFMHGYDAARDVSAIHIADTIAGKWGFDPYTKELTLTDRNVFAIRLNII